MTTADETTDGAGVLDTPDATALAMTPDEVQLCLNRLTNNVNELAEVNWNALVDFDETPADCCTRALSLQAIAGMLQHCATAAQSTVADMVTGMVAASLAESNAGEQ
jgi:hypothetical protein